MQIIGTKIDKTLRAFINWELIWSNCVLIGATQYLDVNQIACNSRHTVQ